MSPTDISHERGLRRGVSTRSRRVYELVDPNVEVQQLATGFMFTEGPIWHPTEHYLLFSDMPGDVRRKWSATAASSR